MNAFTKTVMLAGLLFAPSAFAQSTVSVADIAAETGLTTRQVAMVLGAPTAYAEYRTNFKQARDRLVRSIGQERYVEYIAAYRAGKLDVDSDA